MIETYFCNILLAAVVEVEMVAVDMVVLNTDPRGMESAFYNLLVVVTLDVHVYLEEMDELYHNLDCTGQHKYEILLMVDLEVLYFDKAAVNNHDYMEADYDDLNNVMKKPGVCIFSVLMVLLFEFLSLIFQLEFVILSIMNRLNQL